MSADSSTAGADEAILAQFVCDLDGTGSPRVRDFARLHPHLAGALDELLRARQLLDAVRPIDKALGPFRLEHRIGRGGMGEIWSAVQDAEPRRVAIKLLRPGSSPAARERFRQEVNILRRLRHPNIVRILQSDVEGRTPYFAMRYVDGAELRDIIRAAWHWRLTQRRRPTPTLTELARWAMDRAESPYGRLCGPRDLGRGDEGNPFALPDGAAAAPPGDSAERIELSADYLRSAVAFMVVAADLIEYAHSRGVLHGDIKPSNLMVDSANGSCVLVDFGLARRWADEGPAKKGSLRRLGELARRWAGRVVGDGRSTRGGGAGRAPAEVTGSPAYMAPEAFDGEADPRSDVWGLGVTLFELLTLRRPFAAPTWDVLEKKVRWIPHKRPRQLVREFPERLAAVCDRALQKDPRRRHQTAGEFADHLRSWEKTPSWGGALRGTRHWLRYNLPSWVCGAALAAGVLPCLAVAAAGAGLALVGRFARGEAV